MVGDEMGERLVSIHFRASEKLTAAILKAVLLGTIGKLGSKVLYHATSNKQNIKNIVESGSQTQGVEVSKSEMQGFDKYAKRYHFEYSMTREKNDKTQYFFTFRVKDLDRMQNAAKDWFKDGLDHESIKQKLEEAAEKAYSINRATEKSKQHVASKVKDRGKAL
jgi:hypothetical protein